MVSCTRIEFRHTAFSLSLNCFKVNRMRIRRKKSSAKALPKHPYFCHVVMFLVLLENTLGQDVSKSILNTLWNEEKEKAGIAKHGAGKEGTVSPLAPRRSPAITSSFLCLLRHLCNCWFFPLVSIRTPRPAPILLLKASFCTSLILHLLLQ